MKILVTGGAGFIGSNVADAYVEAGHKVVIVDNLFSGKMENVNGKAKFYHADIRSVDIEKIFEDERPDVVNHHAAQISVPASVKDPMFDADVNIKGFLNVLAAAMKNNTKKIISVSSGGAVYGEACEYPTTENQPVQPLSPYAISKSVCENYLDFYNKQYGLDYTILRYSNVYGPRQIPQGEAGVVAIFIENLLNSRPCAINAYKDEPRGMIRDYCFVKDITRANLLALKKGSRQAINIGTNIETHTSELFDIIYGAVRAMVPGLPAGLSRPQRMEARAGDLKRSCLNIDKARKTLGWEPAVGLEEGIVLTLESTMRKRKAAVLHNTALY